MLASTFRRVILTKKTPFFVILLLLIADKRPKINFSSHFFSLRFTLFLEKAISYETERWIYLWILFSSQNVLPQKQWWYYFYQLSRCQLPWGYGKYHVLRSSFWNFPYCTLENSFPLFLLEELSLDPSTFCKQKLPFIYRIACSRFKPMYSQCFPSNYK